MQGEFSTEHASEGFAERNERTEEQKMRKCRKHNQLVNFRMEREV
jgi:hypothetical protein